MTQQIELPHNWHARPYQRRLWRYLSKGTGRGKRAIAVWHRRSGKDEVALHWTATALMEKPATYWHLLPQANQARKAIWEAVNPHTGKRRIDEAFPRPLRANVREQEMMIRFVNGSTWQVVGSDNYDSLVGSPPYGIVLSEYSLSDPKAWEYLRPILAENGGWAVFIFTPRGRNHAFELYELVKGNGNWFSEVLSVADTGAIDMLVIEDERRSGMSEDMIQQEYFCSFDASVDGTVIPSLWIHAAVDAHRKLSIKPRGERLAALDVADQGIDKNALAVRHGIELIHLQSWSGAESDIFATTEKAFGLCDVHRTSHLVYDSDGMGAGVRGDARVLNDKRKPEGYKVIEVMPHQGSAAVTDPLGEMVHGRKNEDLFDNFKAQSWWALRQRFEFTYRALQGEKIPEDELISIPAELPERAQLIMELSRPTYSTNKAGLILIDKQPDGQKSPNLGDAVCMVFAPRDFKMVIADSVFEEDWNDFN